MSKNSIIVEGSVIDKFRWNDKGWKAKVHTDGGDVVVGFSHELRVPKNDVRVRIQGNKGKFWVFAEKWEYLALPRGKTDGTFPVKGNSELEATMLKKLRSLSEFTVDDFHTAEILNLITHIGRDRRVLGSVLRKFKTRGWIKEIRYVHSKRVECHRRPVVLWTRTVLLNEILGINR